MSSCDSPWSIWSVLSSAAQLLAGLSVPAFTAPEIVAVGRSGVLADDAMRLAVVDLVSHIVCKRLAVCAVALGAELRLVKIVAAGCSAAVVDISMRFSVVDLVRNIVRRQLAGSAAVLGTRCATASRSSLLVARLCSSTSALDSASSIWSV